MTTINHESEMSLKCKACILDHKEELKSMSACQFAEKYNLNYHAVLFWLDKLKIKYAKFGNPNGKHLSNDTVGIVKLLKKGTMTYQQIADLKGISRQRVGQIAKAHGIRPVTKKEMYLARLQSDSNLCNMSAMDISQKHDIPYDTTIKLLAEANLPYSKWNRSVLSEKDYQNLLTDLKRQYLSYAKLAKKYKVSLNWVVSVAKKHKLTRKDFDEED